MKRFVIGLSLMLAVAFGAFAQSDLQPLAVVKLNKSETITLKQLKNRVDFVEKQYEGYGMKKSLSVDEKKQLLESLIDEKLITQAAAKEGLSVTDSQVNAAFLNTFSQQLGQQVTEAQLNDLIQKQYGMSLSDYLLQNTGMSLSDYPIDKFYYYLIVDVDDVVALLGDDLISCCDFHHRKREDIEIVDFDRSLYETTYGGALTDDDVQALIAEVTVSDE